MQVITTIGLDIAKSVFQVHGIDAGGWVRHELMLVYSISLDLFSNVFVGMSEPSVRHTFDAHDQLLLQLSVIFLPVEHLLLAGRF